MGHDTVMEQDAIKDLLKYKDRVFDLHFKDVTQVMPKALPANWDGELSVYPGL